MLLLSYAVLFIAGIIAAIFMAIFIGYVEFLRKVFVFLNIIFQVQTMSATPWVLV